MNRPLRRGLPRSIAGPAPEQALGGDGVRQTGTLRIQDAAEIHSNGTLMEVVMLEALAKGCGPGPGAVESKLSDRVNGGCAKMHKRKTPPGARPGGAIGTTL